MLCRKTSTPNTSAMISSVSCNRNFQLCSLQGCKNSDVCTSTAMVLKFEPNEHHDKQISSCTSVLWMITFAQPNKPCQHLDVAALRSHCMLCSFPALTASHQFAEPPLHQEGCFGNAAALHQYAIYQSQAKESSCQHKHGTQILFADSHKCSHVSAGYYSELYLGRLLCLASASHSCCLNQHQQI